MNPVTRTFITISFKDEDDEQMYLSYIRKRHDGNWDCTAEEMTASESCDISDYTLADQVAMLVSVEQDYTGTEFKLIKVVTTTSDFDFNQDEYREAIQKIALAKLSIHEIEALGLNKIAVYIKTKYHDAQPEESD